MYEQEKQRMTHLAILFGCTIFFIMLAVESILLGWELGTVALLLFGLLASWGIHVSERISEPVRIWLYFILTMLAFFFYGSHKTSIYDLAPVAIFIILVYSTSEIHMIIDLCMAAYYFIVGYDFVFVLRADMEPTVLSVTRTILHFVLVYMAGRTAKRSIAQRAKERKYLDGRIAQLEEINRRTEDFMTNVSHELRTPINAVTGITAVMLKNEEDDSKRKDILSIQMAGHRLFSQIEDILDYSEIDTKKITVSENIYMISSVIHDIVNGQSLQEKEQELILDIDANVPSVLFGDGRKIKKIVQHLVDNAVKFTKKGGIYVRIYAVNKAYGVNLCIKVCDTGIGIDEENLEKINGEIFQANGGRNRSIGGLGLGLPIVYGMVAAMEGFIQIESAKDAGTAVSISIPQKVSDDSPCMVVENREELCLAWFLKLEKYENPEVRNYYNETISHMAKGLDLLIYRVSDIDALEELTARCQLTHLITGQVEYQENTSYFEYLDNSIEVIIVADEHFALPMGSRIHIFRKPFYGWPIVNKLNARSSEDADPFEKKHMVCPDISALVVDDEPMNLLVAEGFLRDYQMRVKTARSGIEAIELCKKEEFDLVFLDHMMPEMDGVEALKRLRQIYKDTEKPPAVIAFTANAVSGAREMFLREGFDEFVSKPIESLELERVLRETLPKSSIQYLDDEHIKNENRENKIPEEPLLERHLEDRMTRLEGAGVLTWSGLQYCRRDMEFYEELLVKFAQDEKQKTVEINDSFAKEDFENYRILVHTLKSSAKMIGADFLSEIAKEAEEAAKNRDAGYIREHHRELVDKYSELAQRILQVFDRGETENTQAAEGAEISKDELARRLGELKDKLDTFEAAGSEALLSQMDGAVYQGESVSRLLSEVRQDVSEFEFGAASEKVEALLGKIEGGE